MLRVMRGALMQNIQIRSLRPPYRLNLFKIVIRHGAYCVYKELEPVLHDLDQIIPAYKRLGQFFLPVPHNVLMQNPLRYSLLHIAIDMPDQRRYA